MCPSLHTHALSLCAFDPRTGPSRYQLPGSPGAQGWSPTQPPAPTTAAPEAYIPATQTLEVDYPTTPRAFYDARDPLDTQQAVVDEFRSIERLKRAARLARSDISDVWHRRYCELWEVVQVHLQGLSSQQGEEVELERQGIEYEKRNKVSTLRFSRGVLDLIAQEAAIDTASRSAKRLKDAQRFEMLREDVTNELQAKRKTYDAAVQRSDISHKAQLRMHALTTRHHRQVTALLARAEKESRRLIKTRDACLLRFDTHVMNAQRTIQHGISMRQGVRRRPRGGNGSNSDDDDEDHVDEFGGGGDGGANRGSGLHPKHHKLQAVEAARERAASAILTVKAHCGRALEEAQCYAFYTFASAGSSARVDGFNKATVSKKKGGKAMNGRKGKLMLKKKQKQKQKPAMALRPSSAMRKAARRRVAPGVGVVDVTKASHDGGPVPNVEHEDKEQGQANREECGGGRAMAAAATGQQRTRRRPRSAPVKARPRSRGSKLRVRAQSPPAQGQGGAGRARRPQKQQQQLPHDPQHRPQLHQQHHRHQVGGPRVPGECEWCGTYSRRTVKIPHEWAGQGYGIFCSWECAKTWNLKYSPLQYRHDRDLLIDIEAGRLVSSYVIERTRVSKSRAFL